MKKNTTKQVTYGKAALGAALAGLALVATMGITTLASTPSPALASEVQAGSTQAAQRTIQVSAGDSVKVLPDMAELSLTICPQGATAQEAQAQAASELDALKVALAALGIDEKNIVASQVNIYARYDWSDYVEKIVGYQASIDITLKELTIDQANSAIPAIASIEDTTLDGTRFYVSTYDERYQEALVSALQVAQAKAQVLAQAAGAQLGAVANVCENYDSQEYRYSSVQAKSEAETMAVAESAAADTGAGNSSDMLNPGEIEIKASISVTYELAS